MNVINFQDANCAHCYKCLRNCDVKAIRIKNGQAQIVRDMCIYCGHCMEICPQKAKTFDSDLDYVKHMLKHGEKLVVSLDSSYSGLIQSNRPGKVVDALYRLGFADVRETAEGAAYVTREYVRLINEGKMENIITTHCPSIVYLVEKHYPMLIPYLAPVVSPMVAHGRLIKEEMGQHTKVVYIGPCVAKKMEAEADRVTMGAVDAVIEFNELEQWLEEEDIDLNNCEERAFSNPDPKINRLYTISAGIIRAVREYGAKQNYTYMPVSTIKGCRELLHSMKRGYLKGVFVELKLCSGGCVNGPGVNKKRGFRFKAVMNIENSTSMEAEPFPEVLSEEKLTRSYTPKQVVEKMPTEQEIKEILKTIGKSNSDTEFNCGACGYMSCRDKAIAICQGKAEAAMCLIRSYENARSQASVVMENIPSIVLIVDKDFRILEFNKKAEDVFKTPRREAIRGYLFDYIDTTEYEEVYLTHESKFHLKKKWPYYDMTVLETIVYIEDTDRILAVIEDVTAEEEKEERTMVQKLNSIKVAQEVIDKQMMTAQKIAELLGETTAETKAILTQLRDYVLEDEGV
ncbi:MAG: PAS domain-containing protein [Clostridiales bacterium]|nr:PAS domain-containing protein [Clostridiales bacterium]